LTGQASRFGVHDLDGEVLAIADALTLPDLRDGTAPKFHDQIEVGVFRFEAKARRQR
jgi:hypothetical protein